MQMKCNMIPREPGQSSFWWRTNMLKATMYINWPLWLKQAIYCICLLSRDDQLEGPDLDFDFISPQIGQSGLWLWSLWFQITPHLHKSKWSVLYKLLPEECSVIIARMKKMSFNFQMEISRRCLQSTGTHFTFSSVMLGLPHRPSFLLANTNRI